MIKLIENLPKGTSNASANTALVLAEARILDGRHGSRTDCGELHHYLAWVGLRSGRRRPAADRAWPEWAKGWLAQLREPIGTP
jgi:hypothetical protein